MQVSRWILIVSSVLLTHCGTSLTSGEILNVEMYGVNVKPTGATGAKNPKWMKFTITGIFLVSGAGDSRLSDTSLSKEYQIVNRPQIVFTKDISSIKGNAYVGAKVTYSQTVPAASVNKADHTLTLGSGEASVTAPITIEQGKTQTLYLKVNWKDTVTTVGTTDTMSNPDLVLTVDE